jgi:hypothetical protein
MNDKRQRAAGTLRRLVLRLLGFKPIEPHNLGGGWRLYEDGHGFLSALNRDNFTGWYLITDKHGRPFRPQNAPRDLRGDSRVTVHADVGQPKGGEA